DRLGWTVEPGHCVQDLCRELRSVEHSLDILVPVGAQQGRQHLLDRLGRTVEPGHRVQDLCRKLLRHTLLPSTACQPDSSPPGPREHDSSRAAINFSVVHIVALHHAGSQRTGSKKWATSTEHSGLAYLGGDDGWIAGGLGVDD